MGEPPVPRRDGRRGQDTVRRAAIGGRTAASSLPTLRGDSAGEESEGGGTTGARAQRAAAAGIQPVRRIRTDGKSHTEEADEDDGGRRRRRQGEAREADEIRRARQEGLLGKERPLGTDPGGHPRKECFGNGQFHSLPDQGLEQEF